MVCDRGIGLVAESFDHLFNIFYRRDDMPTPVETFRHSLSVYSLQPPPSAFVACGQGLRQSTMGEGHRAGSNVGTEIAQISVVDIGPGRCRVTAPDRFTGLTGTTWDVNSDARKGRAMRTRQKWMGIIVVLAVLLLASTGLGHARGGGHGFGGHGFGEEGFGGHEFGGHGFGEDGLGGHEFGGHGFGEDGFGGHGFGEEGFGGHEFGGHGFRGFHEDFDDQ
jgi:hypothetical protein